MAVKLGVIGAGGRMGRELLAAIAAEPGARLAGAVEHADHGCVGARLADGLVIGSNPLALAHASDVLIDFTTPRALETGLEAAMAARRGLVVGTTGLSSAQHATIDRAGRSIAVIQAANMSLAVNLLAVLVEQAAARLNEGWDVEVLELHHRAKADAPSGTALMLGEAAARGRGEAAVAVRGAKRGAAKREIGYASLRGGTAAGEHTVFIAGDGERLELAHRTETRAVFARGAVAAALWLAGKPPGRYAMRDVLGF